jgi:3-hydroxyisobutyrate dehydrogenase-like beta-hydroxyacid dehydrogenase
VAAADGTRFAFIGFGALATHLAAGLREAGAREILAYTRPRTDAKAEEAVAGRMRAAGVRPCRSLEEAVVTADVVIAAVPPGAAQEVADCVATAIRPGTLYVDPAPRGPRDKEIASARITSAGADYVDVAVLGTVETGGHRVPMLAAGTGAERWAQLGAKHGLNVAVVGGPPGTAAVVKLLRSVFLKGRDALLVEMLVAARRYGLDDVLMETIPADAPFPLVADRVLASLGLYADRRADELAASADVEARVGVDPVMARAGEERLRRVGRLGLRERFGGERPTDSREVLALLEELADEF